MTEQEFWIFLEQRGRVQVILGSIDSESPQIQTEEKYLSGHALLPKDYDKLSEEDIISIGELLFQVDAKHKTKEAIIILLAHQTSKTALAILTKYNLMPDRKLEAFAKIALDECLMWNE